VTTQILLAVALLQLLTAVLTLVGVFVTFSHWGPLRRIDRQTTQTNEVLRQVNLANHDDQVAPPPEDGGHEG